MFVNCKDCPAKTWLCEYYNFKPGCSEVLAKMMAPRGVFNDGKVHFTATELLEYFVTVKREFCTCAVDAFCNKTDDKCDKCKEYDQMVEKAKKLLEEEDK